METKMYENQKNLLYTIRRMIIACQAFQEPVYLIHVSGEFRLVTEGWINVENNDPVEWIAISVPENPSHFEFLGEWSE
jgi:uncharacterized membrane protein YebE (DUF533 family)